MAEEVIRGIDVLVIGGGLAGTLAAIKAREAGARQVVQVDKAYAGRSGCSACAAGVISSFLPEEDDREQMFTDMVVRAHHLCDQERLQDHFDDFPARLKEMEDFGVGFERLPDGKLQRHPGRGTGKFVMFHGGLQMMGAMRKAALGAGVKIVDKTMVTGLLTRDGAVSGAVGFHIPSGEFRVFGAKAVVVAAGRCWNKGRNPGNRSATGDGLALAYQVGAVLEGLDQARWNNMAARYDIGPGMNMYVGSGGFFVNSKGERFMERYHPELKDRAPLNILTPSFAMEARRGNAPIFLDLTHLEPETVLRFKRVIPMPMMMFERVGVVAGDRFTRKVEWEPAAIQCDGGLKVNRRYESTVPGLFACGDAIPPGSGEGQRALPGAMTSGGRAGRFAAEYVRECGEPELEREQIQVLREETFAPLNRNDGIEPDQVLLSLQEAISPYDVLILRREERMERALRTVEEIWRDQAPLLCAYDPHYLRMAHEARYMTLVGMLQLRSALFRKESRENLREDYPLIDNESWLKWVTVRREGDGVKVGAEMLPVERYPVKPKPDKTLHPLWQRVEGMGIVKIEQGEVRWA
ncbi:MAG: FAD-dependent oxidoreductase [Dehalococcoidia bacterium]|nr:FAD-dependent oxidoreductase [Dehalococcoidia bacterium]